MPGVLDPVSSGISASHLYYNGYTGVSDDTLCVIADTLCVILPYPLIRAQARRFEGPPIPRPGAFGSQISRGLAKGAHSAARGRYPAKASASPLASWPRISTPKPKNASCTGSPPVYDHSP